MTDRADALAYRIIEGWNSDGVLTEGRSKHALASEIVTVLRDYAEEARREEREVCAAFVERMGALALTIPGAPSPEAAAHVAETCAQIAISIQARGEKG